MTRIANALVTATPNLAGFPVISGYTDSNGQVTLPFNSATDYTLTFSGPAVGRVANFTPKSSTFTLYTVKNKGRLAISIDGQKLSAGNNIYALPGSHPVKPTTKFLSWLPSTLFKDAKASQTSLKMPSSNVSISYISGIVKLLYAVDGYNGNYLATNNAYDPSTNTWTAKANDLTARYDLAAGVINSLLYAVDGYNGNYLATNNAYDPSTNTWTAKANDPTARSTPGTGVINSLMYDVGGRGVTGFLKINKAYDPSLNTWTAKKSMPVSRKSGYGAVVASKLYIIGGYEAGSQNYSFDPVTSVWTTKADTLRSSSQGPGGAAAIHDRIYIGANNNNNGGVGYFSQYNPSTNVWISEASLSSAPRSVAMTATNSSVYIIDGISIHGISINKNHVYDPLTNTWALKAGDPTTRGFLVAGVA